MQGKKFLKVSMYVNLTPNRTRNKKYHELRKQHIAIIFIYK